VETVDYITPVVDDPYTFGAIAAANALSDIYAMGGRPLFALNIVGFPTRSLPLSILGEVLRGGSEKAAEAGVSIVGGHSINDNEPKYGLCVTGLVNPTEMVTNAGAEPGDALILTKPLGIGIITTGIDQRLVDEAAISRAVEVMTALNAGAAEAMLKVGVHACTDVTGFGLLGHLREMTAASKTGAIVHFENVPVLPEAWPLIQAGVVPDGTHNNYRFLKDYVSWDSHLSLEERLVLCDAQTSGGLLIAVPREKKAALAEALTTLGVTAAEVGQMVQGTGGRIHVMRSQDERVQDNDLQSPS